MAKTPGISGNSRVIQLCSGGRLCVAFENVRFFDFDADERALLSAVVDAMHAYEQKRREQLEADEKPPSPSNSADIQLRGDGPTEGV